MSKIKVTQQQRDNLLDAMHNMWPSVPEANVSRRLGSFREDCKNTKPTCNTIACFGGWCAWWPPFRSQGVSCTLEGFPKMGSISDYNVSTRLFGDVDGFLPRNGHPADAGFTGTDHALVANRLQWLLDNSEVQP